MVVTVTQAQRISQRSKYKQRQTDPIYLMYLDNLDIRSKSRDSDVNVFRSKCKKQCKFLSTIRNILKIFVICSLFKIKVI